MKLMRGRPADSRLSDVDVSVWRRGGHEERTSVVPAEAARGDVPSRYVEHAVEAASFVVATDTTTAPEGDPDAAVVVDGEPVGDAVTPVDRDERPSVVDTTRRLLEVEDVDALCSRVDVVHASVVSRPADSVRQRHSVEDSLETGVVTVEGARVRRLIEAHRSDPEATGGVAGAVVRSNLRSMREPGEGMGRLVGEIDQCQAIGKADEHRTAGCGRGRTHHRLEGNRAVRPVLEDVQRAAFDVHPQQAPRCGIPARPFRKLRIGVYGDLHHPKVRMG